MLVRLQKFVRIATVAVLWLLASSVTVSAQTGNLFESFTEGAAVYETNEVEAMYSENAELPLGGFFAKRFTRTFTLLGGANFTAGDFPGESVGFLPAPATGSPLTEIVSDTNDVGYVISGAMGRRHNQRLRSEIELAVRGNDFDGFFRNDITTPGNIPFSSSSPTDFEGNLNAYSLMKNVIFDFPNQSRFTPYLGAGVGISYVEVETEESNFISSTSTPLELSEEDTVFSYQFIGGVAARVNHATDFIVEYRFFGTTDVEFEALGSTPYRVNNLFLGVKLEY